jgi:hypothetical protein
MSNIEIRKENEGECFNFKASSSENESVQLQKRTPKRRSHKRPVKLNKKSKSVSSDEDMHRRSKPQSQQQHHASTKWKQPLNDDMYEMLTNPNKKIESDEEESQDDSFEEEPTNNHGGAYVAEDDSYEDTPSSGFRTIEEEKQDLLYKLYRSQSKGIHVTKKYNVNSDIHELRNEVKRITRELDVKSSLRFSRRSLMAIITGLEYLNKTVDPFDLKLDGWSDSIMENIDDYDNVFEKLHDKYSNSISVAPEIELLMLIGGSAFMFNLSNTMINSVPNINQMMRQNPDIIKGMMSTLSQSTSSTTTTATKKTEDQPSHREMKPPMIDLSHLMMGGIPLPKNETVPFVPKDLVPVSTREPTICITSDDEDSTNSNTDMKQISFSESTASKQRRRRTPKNTISSEKVLSI